VPPVNLAIQFVQCRKRIFNETFVKIKTLVIVERLNILDAAQRVLSETQTAMTTREILKYAAEKQYWVSDAPTPWLTLHAAISRDIQTGGEQSRFVKTERGRFALR